MDEVGPLAENQDLPESGPSGPAMPPGGLDAPTKGLPPSVEQTSECGGSGKWLWRSTFSVGSPALEFRLWKISATSASGNEGNRSRTISWNRPGGVDPQGLDLVINPAMLFSRRRWRGSGMSSSPGRGKDVDSPTGPEASGRGTGEESSSYPDCLKSSPCSATTPLSDNEGIGRGLPSCLWCSGCSTTAHSSEGGCIEGSLLSCPCYSGCPTTAHSSGQRWGARSFHNVWICSSVKEASEFVEVQ